MSESAPSSSSAAAALVPPRQQQQQQRDYHHPFEPYDIQLEFMNAVYDCLEDGKIGIFESPTGELFFSPYILYFFSLTLSNFLFFCDHCTPRSFPFFA
jgi:hypothetical protein